MSISYYAIVNDQSGLALDLDGESTGPGTRVTTAEKSPHKDSQLWYDDTTTRTIRNKTNDLCLEFQGVLTGGEIVVNPYRKGNSNQLWLRSGGFISSFFVMDNVIEADPSTPGPGGRLVKSPKNNEKSQSWTFLVDAPETVKPPAKEPEKKEKEDVEKAETEPQPEKQTTDEKAPLLPQPTSSSDKSKSIFTPKRVVAAVIGLVTCVALALALTTVLRGGSPTDAFSDFLAKVKNSTVASTFSRIGGKVIGTLQNTTVLGSVITAVKGKVSEVIGGNRTHLATILLASAKEFGGKFRGGKFNQTDFGSFLASAKGFRDRFLGNQTESGSILEYLKKFGARFLGGSENSTDLRSILESAKKFGFESGSNSSIAAAFEEQFEAFLNISRENQAT